MGISARIATGTALVLGIAMLANGIAMLWGPQDWYWRVPGVSTTGGYNQHFIRDIGLMYVLIGAGFMAGPWLGASRAGLWSFAAAWLAGHALFHFWEVAVGICGPDAIPRDFLGVTLPAILAVILAGSAWRMHGRRA